MNHSRTRIILGAVVVLFLGSAVLGAKLLTAPVDTTSDAPTCESRTIAVGEELTTNLVKVNVYNASQRSGLANRVNINLQRKGFLSGEIGNNDWEITTKTVTILTSDPDDPQVKLVAGQFKDEVQYEAPPKLVGGGVTILVGDDYKGLKDKAIRAIESDRSLQFCLPLVPIT